MYESLSDSEVVDFTNSLNLLLHINSCLSAESTDSFTAALFFFDSRIKNTVIGSKTVDWSFTAVFPNPGPQSTICFAAARKCRGG